MLTWRRSGLWEVVRLLLTRESLRVFSLRKAIKGGVLKMFFMPVSVVRMLKFPVNEVFDFFVEWVVC